MNPRTRRQRKQRYRFRRWLARWEQVIGRVVPDWAARLDDDRRTRKAIP